MESKSLHMRLAAVGRDVVDLYCRLFGYSTVIVGNECSILPSDLTKLGLKLGCNVLSSKEEAPFTLVVDAFGASGREDVDRISEVQFAIDLEAVSSMPRCAGDALSRQDWIEKILDYVNGFVSRGWLVKQDLRPTLSRDVQCTPDRSSVLPASQAHRVLVICDGSSARYEELLASCKNEARIERYWLAYLLREWTVELLCDHYRPRFESRGVVFLCAHWAWGFDNYFGKGSDPTSVQIERREEFSRAGILENVPKHSSFLAGMFGVGSEEAICRFKAVSTIPPIIDPVGAGARHSDMAGIFLNVENGDRKTTNVPKSWKNTIHLFGGCTFFGYAVEDENTVASILQRSLNETSPGEWRVVNHGTWGGNFEHCHKRIGEMSFCEGDVVLVSHAMGNSLGGEGWFDLSSSLEKAHLQTNQFYDRLVHCGMRGYEAVAEGILAQVEKSHVRVNTAASTEFTVNPVQGIGDDSLLPPPELTAYTHEILGVSPFRDTVGKSTGALIMNCNPFTLGHRYIIEYAANQVDQLYIFVVEEDKSFFPFRDRIDLVRKGTSDLKNVFVCRSGAFIISAATFPGYFVKDNPGEIGIDPTLDVEIFGKWLAPAFGISVRFVGEEPFDQVTRNYNRKMQAILPRYGIDIVEIPRKTQEIDGEEMAISASTVRKFLNSGNLESLKHLTPSTTYEYLLTLKRACEYQ